MTLDNESRRLYITSAIVGSFYEVVSYTVSVADVNMLEAHDAVITTRLKQIRF